MNIDGEMKRQAGYNPFDLSKYLDPSALMQLQQHNLASWSWDGYSEYYSQFANALGEAKKQNASALTGVLRSPSFRLGAH